MQEHDGVGACGLDSLAAQTVVLDGAQNRGIGEIDRCRQPLVATESRVRGDSRRRTPVFERGEGMVAPRGFEPDDPVADASHDDSVDRASHQEPVAGTSNALRVGMMRRNWLAFAVLLVLTLWSPRSSEARPYGAIAYDEKTGAWGVAHDQASQQTANQRALDQCRKRGPGCEVVVRFWGELCGAYATGPGKAAGWGSGDTRLAAERNAVVACHRQGQGCQPRVWSCNARSGGNEAFSPTRMCHFWDSAAQAYVTRPCSSR